MHADRTKTNGEQAGRERVQSVRTTARPTAIKHEPPLKTMLPYFCTGFALKQDIVTQ